MQLCMLVPFYLRLHWSIDYSLSYLSYLTFPTPSSYDYIIIGAGSAGLATFNLQRRNIFLFQGCLVAGRLSAAGHTVLLVEAGGSAPALVHVPGLVANLQRGVLDWAFKTEEQDGAGRSGGGVSRWDIALSVSLFKCC